MLPRLLLAMGFFLSFLFFAAVISTLVLTSVTSATEDKKTSDRSIISKDERVNLLTPPFNPLNGEHDISDSSLSPHDRSERQIPPFGMPPMMGPGGMIPPMMGGMGPPMMGGPAGGMMPPMLPPGIGGMFGGMGPGLGMPPPLPGMMMPPLGPMGPLGLPNPFFTPGMPFGPGGFGDVNAPKCKVACDRVCGGPLGCRNVCVRQCCTFEPIMRGGERGSHDGHREPVDINEV